MDKFFRDLEAVLEKYNYDETALDDYEVDVDFIKEILKPQYEKQKTQIKLIENIHVFDGPHNSAISVSLSVRFDITLVPDYNIEEKQNLKLFIKVPPFEGQTESAAKLCQKEIRVYSELFKDIHNFMSNPLKGAYKATYPELIYSNIDKKLLVLSNVAEEGLHCPRDRLMDRHEMKSVLRALAKFHADGMKFLRENDNQTKYSFIEKNPKRYEFVTDLLEKYLDPYLNYLDQFTPIKPAVLLLREMSKKGTLADTVFKEMEKIPRPFNTICHMNIWTGNLFLQEKPSGLAQRAAAIDHNVVLVDWTHCQVSPFTMDVIHLIFTCCGAEVMGDWTEMLNDYYDYIKGHLSTHALDRNNLGLNFDAFWEAVSKTLRAEFVEEAVVTPLTLLFGRLAKDESPPHGDDLTDMFEAADMIEEDVLPMMQMAMELGLTKPVESLHPELFREAGRRGSVLSGKLVTRRESLKDPVPACVRRKRSSLAPRMNRRQSHSRDSAEGSSGPPTPSLSRSGSFHQGSGRRRSLSRSNSRRDSGAEDPQDPMAALRTFQLMQSKQYKKQVQSSTETLGSALKMIKKRRSLFEHASVFGYGSWGVNES